MTDYQLVESKLEKFPDFRERKLRSKFLSILALRECGFMKEGESQSERILNLLELSDFAIKYDSLRHAWTDVTKERKDLRGSDWEEKTVLEQKKKVELGYLPNEEWFNNLK